MARAYANTSHLTRYNAGDSATAAVDWATTAWMVPKNWKGDGTVPLIIYCHGAGQDGWSPMDPTQFGQLGNLTALAEAGYPILSCDWGGNETWARQQPPTGRQNANNTGSGTSISVTLGSPVLPKSLIKLSVLYNALVPTTPACTGFANVPGGNTNNTGNFNLYVLDKLVAVGGEQTFTVTGIPSGATHVAVIVEEFYGWAGTPTRDYIHTAIGISATNVTGLSAASSVLPSELATASVIWGGTVGSVSGIWGNASSPPGTVEAVNYPGVEIATLAVNGVGSVSGVMGSSVSWTTARNAGLVDVSYYDKVTAPDFTNARTVIDYINDGITWAASNLGASTTKIGLFGTSMGGLNSLYYAAHNLSKIGCWAGVGPVNDLNDMVTNNRGGFAARINTCYPGGYSNATYGANHDPTTMAAAAAYGSLPMQIWYGASDTIVAPATVTNFQSLVGGSCSINSMAGGHAESTWAEVDTDTLVSFFRANL